eukprot:scaffold447717_cov30-Prasinocladus_malaysianus.AAC.1
MIAVALTRTKDRSYMEVCKSLLAGTAPVVACLGVLTCRLLRTCTLTRPQDRNTKKGRGYYR